MRKVYTILFLLILLVNLVGVYMYFGVRLWQAHEEMKVSLQKDGYQKLSKLLLSPQEFNAAIVNSSELKINGKMFDVVRKEMRDDLIVVYGVFDDDENFLLELIEFLAKHSSKDKKPLPQSFKTVLVCCNNIKLPDFRIKALKLQHDTPYISRSFVVTLKIDSPPPKQNS